MPTVLTKVIPFRVSPERHTQLKQALEQLPWCTSLSDLIVRSIQAFLDTHLPLNGDIKPLANPDVSPARAADKRIAARLIGPSTKKATAGHTSKAKTVHPKKLRIKSRK